MNKRFCFLFFLYLILGGGLFFGFRPFLAQAVTVGPVKLELEGNPGDILTGEFYLMNDSGYARTFYSDFEKYTSPGGTKKIFLGVKEDLSSWVETQESVTLQGKQQIYIPYTIRIPQDAPAGSLFAVAWWGSMPPSGDEGKVGITSKAGILMMLNVLGDVHEEASIDTFSIGAKKIFDFLPVYDSVPDSFAVSIKNTGNAYAQPKGTIVVRNMLKKEELVFDVNLTILEVYPGTTNFLRITQKFPAPPQEKVIVKPREEMDLWGNFKYELDNFGIGLYTAELNLDYGKYNNYHLADKIRFYIFPWRVLTLIVIITIFILWFFTRGVKRYNRWVVRRAQALQEQGKEMK